MRNSGQRTRIEAHVAEQFAPWSSEAEDRAVRAWNAVQRITPEIARQEPQAVAEMIAHLQAVLGEAA